MDHKPLVFIASSSESVAVARAFQMELSGVAEVSVWDQAQFRPMRFPLESLMEILGRSDLGIFIFSPDERVPVTDGQRAVVRDNVLIELGLFIGRLGRERVAIVVREDVQPRIPSDLHGLTLLRYRADRSDKNIAAAIAPAAQLIRLMLSDLPSSTIKRAPEFDLPLMMLRHKLSRNQRHLLATVEQRHSCPVRDLRILYKHWTQSELHYRLEQLRLFSFLHILNAGEASLDPARAVYHLHDHYLMELAKHPPSLEHDTLQFEDEQTADRHLPPNTDSLPLDGATSDHRPRTR